MLRWLTQRFAPQAQEVDTLQNYVDRGLRRINTATDLELEAFVDLIAKTSHTERAQVAQDALSFMLRKLAFELEEGTSGVRLGHYLEQTYIRDIAPQTLLGLANSGDVYVRETLAKLVTSDNIAHAPEVIERLSQSSSETRQALQGKFEL